MRPRAAIISACLAVGFGGAAFAHHGWGSYDASKTMTIEAAVSRVDWQNPHVHIAVNHAGGTWDVVLAPPFRMQARGLSPESIGVDARVRVEGYPSTRAEREMRAERIAVDGKVYELR